MWSLGVILYVMYAHIRFLLPIHPQAAFLMHFLSLSNLLHSFSFFFWFITFFLVPIKSISLSFFERAYRLSGTQPFDEDNGEPVFEQIKHARFSFTSSDIWASVSAEAKDLIRHLLVLEPARRYKAQDVIDHPWMQETLLPVAVPEEVQTIICAPIWYHDTPHNICLRAASRPLCLHIFTAISWSQCSNEYSAILITAHHNRV